MPGPIEAITFCAIASAGAMTVGNRAMSTDSVGSGGGYHRGTGTADNLRMIEDACDHSVIERLSEHAWRDRIPISGSFAITHRCNFSCRHCYVPLQDRTGQEEELSTKVVTRLLDECAEAGCLYMLLTGGEPLIRPDFAEIWIHAKRKGMILTLFTNGSLVKPEVAELLTDWPPFVVEITLYGASEETYGNVTGMPGAYKAARDGIERLLSAGLKVRLKSLITKSNRHDLQAMEDMASAYGVRFRIDAALFARLDGDRTPLSLRLTPEESVQAEFANKNRSDDWRRFYSEQERLPSLLPEDSLYDCGAGVMSFHIDPKGRLYPCVMVRTVSGDAATEGFCSAWLRIVGGMRDRRTPADWPCKSCEMRTLCGYCPGFFEFESGSEMVPSNYLCRLGQNRGKIIRETCGSARR